MSRHNEANALVIVTKAFLSVLDSLLLVTAAGRKEVSLPGVPKLASAQAESGSLRRSVSTGRIQNESKKKAAGNARNSEEYHCCGSGGRGRNLSGRRSAGF